MRFVVLRAACPFKKIFHPLKVKRLEMIYNKIILYARHSYTISEALVERENLLCKFCLVDFYVAVVALHVIWFDATIGIARRLVNCVRIDTQNVNVFFPRSIFQFNYTRCSVNIGVGFNIAWHNAQCDVLPKSYCLFIRKCFSSDIKSKLIFEEATHAHKGQYWHLWHETGHDYDTITKRKWGWSGGWRAVQLLFSSIKAMGIMVVMTITLISGRHACFNHLCCHWLNYNLINV